MQTQSKYTDEQLAAMVRHFVQAPHSEYFKLTAALRQRGVPLPGVKFRQLAQRLHARGLL